MPVVQMPGFIAPMQSAVSLVLSATDFDWIASSVSLVSWLVLNSTHVPIQLSLHGHTVAYRGFNMQECWLWRLILYVYVPVVFGSMTWCCVFVSVKETFTDFVSCSLSTFFLLSLCVLRYFLLFPLPLTPPSCYFCTCLPRCKQVHAPLIPAPTGPPKCGAVWGNGGHGTRRGFWIQSIQKRPGSFLAEF